LGRRGYKDLKRKSRASRRGTSKIFIFATGFMVFLTVNLYGILYVKKKIEETPQRRPSSDLPSRIKEADTRIMSALFNLGVNLKDIESKKFPRNKGEAAWEFKDIAIQLPEGVPEKRVKLALKDALSAPNVWWGLKKNGDSLISEVEVYGLPTHRLSFNFYERNQKMIENLAQEKKQSGLSGEWTKLPEGKPATRGFERQAFNGEKPKIVIIVDDLGSNKESVDRLLKIPASITFAVLPNLPYSRYAASMGNSNGRDVILHIPMEPMDSSEYVWSDSRDGTLLTGLPKSEILSKLDKDLASVPYIKGVNNHMGSKFTEDSELMELVLHRIKSKGLFFVDSRTSSKTTGFEIAKKLGMKTAERDVFLDEGSVGADYIRSQMEKLIAVSKEKGYALGICHPYPDTLATLTEMIPEIKKEVEIIPVSGLWTYSTVVN
jgi:polysaccharide deacetylase 2 family uncharacterized protein YibQ